MKNKILTILISVLLYPTCSAVEVDDWNDFAVREAYHFLNVGIEKRLISITYKRNEDLIKKSYCVFKSPSGVFYAYWNKGSVRLNVKSFSANKISEELHLNIISSNFFEENFKGTINSIENGCVIYAVNRQINLLKSKNAPKFCKILIVCFIDMGYTVSHAYLIYSSENKSYAYESNGLHILKGDVNNAYKIAKELKENTHLAYYE
jgi:hypothetical protein